MGYLQFKITLGLTATPVRKDGLESLIFMTLGPLAHHVTMSGRDDVTVKTRMYSCARYRTTPAPVNSQGTIDTPAVIRQLVEDPDRTAALVEEITALAMSETRHILVLSHRRGHCEDIVGLLRARGVDVGLCIGGQQDVSHSVTVATYSLVSEGFDLPRLNVLVLATPASDVTQAVGRILRTDASATPLIVDFVDTWAPCVSLHVKRKSIYRKSGFRVA